MWTFQLASPPYMLRSRGDLYALTAAMLCAAIVTLMTTALSASASTPSRPGDTQLTIVLKINVDRTPAADEFSIAGAIAEANRLWRPYGVSLVRTTRRVTEPSFDVDLQELPVARNPRAALMTPLAQ
jgi:hypothetical protein